MEKRMIERYRERNDIIKTIISLEKELEDIKDSKGLNNIIKKGIIKRIELLTIRKDIIMNGIIRESLDRKKDLYS